MSTDPNPDVGPDLGVDALPGEELNRVLRAAREQGPVVPVRFMGMTAQLLTTVLGLSGRVCGLVPSWEGGGCAPRASIASAMRGSGRWKPYAIRFDIERFGGPRDDVERVRAANC